MTPTLPANCIHYPALDRYTGLVHETKKDTKAAEAPIDPEGDLAENALGKRKKISQISFEIGFQNFLRSERPYKKVTSLFEGQKENIKINCNASSIGSSLASLAKGTVRILPQTYSVPKTDIADQSTPPSLPEADFEKGDIGNFKSETIKEQTSQLLREARQAFETEPEPIEEFEIKCYWKRQFPLGGEQHPSLKAEEMQKLFEGYLSEECDEEFTPDPFSRRATVSFETFNRVVKGAEAQKQDGAKIREAFIKDWIKMLKNRGIPVEETVASLIRIAARKDLLLTLNYPEYAEKMLLAVQWLEGSPEKDKIIRDIAGSLLNEARLLIFI